VSSSKIFWGSFEVRRLAADALRNCPNQFLLWQQCELEVNDFCGETVGEGKWASRFGNGDYVVGLMGSGVALGWAPGFDSHFDSQFHLAR